MEIIDKNIKYVQYTEGRFASFFSGGFTYYGSNESTGKETGKMHLCAVYWKCKVKLKLYFKNTFVPMSMG